LWKPILAGREKKELLECFMQGKLLPTRRLALVLLIAFGINAAGRETEPRQPEPKGKLPALLTTDPLKPEANDDEVRKLLKARYNEAIAELKAGFSEFQTGRTTITSILGTFRRIVESGADLEGSQDEKGILLEQLLEVAKEIEKINKSLVDVGRATISEMHQARYLRINAESNSFVGSTRSARRRRSNLRRESIQHLPLSGSSPNILRNRPCIVKSPSPLASVSFSWLAAARTRRPPTRSRPAQFK
jgi:hypothetical protein